MPVIDSYPEFVPDHELQANLEPKPLDLAVQGSPASRLAALRSLVIDSVSSPNSKRAYGKAVDAFLGWYEREPRGSFSKALLQSYRSSLEQQGLAAATINVHLSALRRLTAEAADNGLLNPDIAAGIAKIKGTHSRGVRTGNWLTKEQAETMLRLPDVSTLKGKRDRALLSLLIGCGLRRSEAAGLNVEDIQQRDGRWVVPDLLGKHGRIRTVPMPGWTKVDIDAWLASAGITSGRIFCAVHKGGGILRHSLTAQSIFLILVDYGQIMGVKFAPHDARRSFAKLAYRGRAAIEQIQITLGHASITTTERYLGVRQDLSDAPCDHLGLDLDE
jgi:integrase